MFVSLLVMILAILSKEMAYVVPGMLLLLALDRPKVAPSPRRPLAPSLAVGIAFLTTAVLWLLRRLFVPEALGFKWKGLYSLAKLYHALGGPLGAIALADDFALPVAALGAALLLGALARRGHLPLGVLAALVWAGLAFQLLGESWTRLFLDPNPWFLLRGLWYWFALAWLWQARRREPVLFAAGSLVLILLPLLHHGGVHYYYWPSAAWAILNTVVVAALRRAQ
jgi:hypothetical protein